MNGGSPPTAAEGARGAVDAAGNHPVGPSEGVVALRQAEIGLGEGRGGYGPSSVVRIQLRTEFRSASIETYTLPSSRRRRNRSTNSELLDVVIVCHRLDIASNLERVVRVLST